MLHSLIIFTFMFQIYTQTHSFLYKSLPRSLIHLSARSDDGGDSSGSSNHNQTTSDFGVPLFPLDPKMMVEMMDEDVLQHMDALSIPRAPRTEEEIQEDSFEGFLRMQFNGLLPSKPSSNPEYRAIDFETFLVWRKRMGVVLTRKEIESIFVSVTNNEEQCTLMQFIEINHIIDENNAGNFRS